MKIVRGRRISQTIEETATGRPAASGRRRRTCRIWLRGMETAPMATLTHSARTSSARQSRKGRARGKKFPCAGRERRGRVSMGIDLTFLAKVDGSRCGRATWLAKVRLTVARQRRTFTGFASAPLLRGSARPSGVQSTRTEDRWKRAAERRWKYTGGNGLCQRAMGLRMREKKTPEPISPGSGLQFEKGSSARIRTWNPSVNSRLLCRLSYRGKLADYTSRKTSVKKDC